MCHAQKHIECFRYLRCFCTAVQLTLLMLGRSAHVLCHTWFMQAWFAYDIELDWTVVTIVTEPAHLTDTRKSPTSSTLSTKWGTSLCQVEYKLHLTNHKGFYHFVMMRLWAIRFDMCLRRDQVLSPYFITSPTPITTLIGMGVKSNELLQIIYNLIKKGLTNYFCLCIITLASLIDVIYEQK